MSCPAPRGLISARPVAPPKFIRCTRPRGAKAFGLRYERLVAEATGGVHGQWWEYTDIEGRHWCQTDVLLRLGCEVAILECKLRNIAEADAQLAKYAPIVECALGLSVRAIVVVRHLDPNVERERLHASVGSALEAARVGEAPVVHWLGRGPI